MKLDTPLGLRRNILTFVHISDGKLHDVNILDQLIPEAGALCIVDRGYAGFERLYRMRWQVELSFKWVKQHLRIKTFFGTYENAVKSQI